MFRQQPWNYLLSIRFLYCICHAMWTGKPRNNPEEFWPPSPLNYFDLNSWKLLCLFKSPQYQCVRRQESDNKCEYQNRLSLDLCYLRHKVPCSFRKLNPSNSVSSSILSSRQWVTSWTVWVGSLCWPASFLLIWPPSLPDFHSPHHTNSEHLVGFYKVF